MPHMTTYGAQMYRKWTGSDRKWTGSAPEVDWKCPSVRLYVCPSQTIPLKSIFYKNDLRKSKAPKIPHFCPSLFVNKRKRTNTFKENIK